MSTNEFSRSGLYRDTPPPPYESLQPVLNQPSPHRGTSSVTNTASPTFPVTCLPGLESLRGVDQLTIEKEPVDFCSCSCEPFYTYNVKNNLNQQLFSISPVNVGCASYDMQLFDSFGNPIVLFQRCLECCSSLRIEIIHTLGTIIGCVQREAGFFNTAFVVGDAHNQAIFKVKRTSFEFFSGNVDFGIKSAGGSVEVGKITRVWTGWMSAQHLYNITFPRDLVAEMKVALLGAWYMIEASYQASRRNHDS
ncbi:phospholipid scramblase 1-like [Zophobas morio]|uniref:phospholipid scramblase 1-like n=1 Tax=Zophobas morio TaxID=2755281 RepID=UPI0030835EF5